MTSAFLTTKQLNIGYANKSIMENINIQLHPKEFIGLLGPNGSGKSTLVKSLLGVMPKISGEIHLAKNLITSYVPQKLKTNSSIPMTVTEFLNLKQVNFSKEWFQEVIEIVNLESKLNSSIHSLSGGQLQRLFIAYALLSKPKLLILDEATEGMDLSSLQEVFKKLKTYIEKENACLVYITHDISAVNEVCSRVLCLHKDIAYDGSPTAPDFHTCLHSIYGEKSFIHDHRH